PDEEYLRYTFNETLNTLERRVGTGGRIDRGNIAVSLLGILEKGKVPAQRQPILLETICRHGGPNELKKVWEHVLKPDEYAPALRRRVLELLAEAAATRRVQPEVAAADVRKLLGEGGDGALLPDAVRLAGAWKRKDLG